MTGTLSEMSARATGAVTGSVGLAGTGGGGASFG